MKFLLILIVSLVSGCASIRVVDNPSADGKTAPVRLIIKEQETVAPTVLLSHGSGCVIPPDYIWLETVYSWGYNAIIIDHCSRRSIGRHTGQFLPGNLKVINRIEDYITVAKWVREQPLSSDKVALIGFSRGGEGVMGFTNEPYYVSYNWFPSGYTSVIDAAVAYYPSCINPAENLLEPTIPILVHHGLADQLTPAKYCEHVKTINKGTELNPNFQVEFYEDAHHGFDTPGPRLVTDIRSGTVITKQYYPAAATKSINITRKFLEVQLGD
jgi:dienelactone hydrolase